MGGGGGGGGEGEGYCKPVNSCIYRKCTKYRSALSATCKAQREGLPELMLEMQILKERQQQEQLQKGHIYHEHQ